MLRRGEDVGGGRRDGAAYGGETTARGRAGAPAQLARRAADEHVVGRRVEHPVVALARVVVVPRHLHETLVQRQIVPDRVLPALSAENDVSKTIKNVKTPG